MVNKSSSSIDVALLANAVSLDEKLSEAYYIKQVFQTEQAVARYKEIYGQSLDAWTTYWRVLDKVRIH
jgi:hypothetical protein